MADTGKQSPLGQNVLGGLLQNRCIQINPNAQDYMGISRSNDQYTFGTLVEGTVLRMLTWSINDAYLRGLVSNSVYNNIISISGNGACYALGNSKPPTYVVEDPSDVWTDKSKEAAQDEHEHGSALQEHGGTKRDRAASEEGREGPTSSIIE